MEGNLVASRSATASVDGVAIDNGVFGIFLTKDIDVDVTR